MMRPRWLPTGLPVLIALSLACGLPVAPAQAATSCTASTTPMTFADVGSTQRDSTATVTISCTTTGLTALAQVRVRMCLNLDGGGTASTQTAPRQMANGFGDLLGFQIYRDAARSLIAGSPTTPSTPTPIQVDLTYSAPLLGGSGGTSATLYGRVPVQVGLAAGTFQNAFDATHASLSYRYAEALIGTPAYPATCTTGGTNGGTTGFGFTATATVLPRCTLSTATDLDFGNVPGFITADRDQTSTVTFTCTGRTPWQVGLDNGLHASGTNRRMRLGTSSNYVGYELYRNAGHSQRWGATLNSDTATGTTAGSTSTQSLTVHGRVPAGQTAAPGAYRDTITVTVTY
ncbi:Csu type fimbrial protein [Luteimonas sp. RIT-PG2_3]